jgi:hypothetical protein
VPVGLRFGEDSLVEGVGVLAEVVVGTTVSMTGQLRSLVQGLDHTHLKLASCSRMLCLPRSSNVKVVAFGVGLVLMASPKRNLLNSSLMFSAVPSAWITRASDMAFPSWGKNSWFARVLSIGQGARTGARC